MINANELRIWNYVLFDSQVDRIVSVLAKSVNGEFHSYWNYDRIHGIPITPDILEKCGFEVDRMWYIKNGVCLGWITKEDCLQVSICHPQTNGNKLYHETVIDVPFVHTLQNYWPAWTGTELNITL